MQRSPCHDCYLAAADKNGPECLNCEKRTAYVAALEGRSGPVPMEMTDMARRNDPEKYIRDDQFIRDNQDMPPAQIAEQLGRSLFAVYTRRSALGLTKNKRGAASRAADDLRKKIKDGHPSFSDAAAPAAVPQDKAPAAPTAAPTAELVPAKDLLLVNVHGFEDLYERLKRSAKENFRTPELQALWFIHQSLQAEDGARDQRRAPDRSS